MSREQITKRVVRIGERFYRDGIRISGRAAHKAAANRAAMDRKFRDDRGRVKLRAYEISATRKPRGTSHADTDTLTTFAAPIGFDHEPDDEEIRAYLDKEFKGYSHFDIAHEASE